MRINTVKKYVGILLISPCLLIGQNKMEQANLQNVVEYALKNSPTLQSAVLDQQVTDLSIKNKLADWYPQVNLSYDYTHNFIIPTSSFGFNSTVDNVSNLGVSVSQNILNRDLWYAKKTAEDTRFLTRQNTLVNQVNTIAQVKKAFYDVLTTQQQIILSKQDIERIEKSLEVATYQYQGGIVDKTDKQRASISLNNAKAQKRTAEELYKAKVSYLKQLMGYPEENELSITYDLKDIEKEAGVLLDDQLDYSKSVEYQYLKGQQKLKEIEIQYNKKSWLPTISANGGYNLGFFNEDLDKLYNTAHDGLYAGIGLSWSIFQGGKRKNNNEITQLQISQLAQQEENLKNVIDSNYQQAMANYKASFANYEALKENVKLSEEVYNILNLQYKSGVKSYLEVFTAETDLRNARINYLNALYTLVAAKVDVERALGNIRP